MRERNTALAYMTASVCDTSAEDRIAVMQMVAEGEIDLDEVRHPSSAMFDGFMFWFLFWVWPVLSSTSRQNEPPSMQPPSRPPPASYHYAANPHTAGLSPRTRPPTITPPTPHTAGLSPRTRRDVR